MAQKRMFDKRVVESDMFIDLPNSTKALYFMAGMQADDRGFFQPRILQRMCGFTDDDYKILLAKKFFIAFESGIMVITDWNKNNWLDKRRITETEYTHELELLKLINDKYVLSGNDIAKPMLSQNSIEENSIEKNSIECIDSNRDTGEEKDSTKKKNKYGFYKHVLLTHTEYEKLQQEYPNYEELITYLDEYIEMKGYKAKSHYLCIKKWVIEAVNERKTKKAKEIDWRNL